MATTEGHPVWDVYDELRTARLNVKYYGCLLANLQTQNTAFEISLAVTASSSVAGLWFWGTSAGTEVWKSLTAITALLAVAQPFLKFSDKIRSHEEVLTGYRTLEHDLLALKIDIKQQGAYTELHKTKLAEALERKGALVAKTPRPKVSKRLSRKCRAEIDAELPVTQFFIPEASS